MRYAILPTAMLAFTGLAFGQGKKTAVEPIKVIAIQRSEPVSYEKEIEPILAEKCQFCHSGPVKEGKFDMGSFETLVKGGKSGQALVSGKSAESLLVKLSGRIMKPIMPPKSEEPLTPQELALLKLWIDQGAKATGGKREKSKVILSALPAIVHQVHAIAVSPDKSAVAAGRANRIDIYDAGSGTHIRTLVNPELTGADKSPTKTAHAAVVESLTYSPNGKFLASGSFQEVQIWDAQLGLPRKKLTGFADRVVAMAFSPNGKILATGGGAPTEDGEIPRQLEEWRENPEKIFSKQQMRAFVETAILSLPTNYREVFVFRDVQGLTTLETSEALGISLANTKSRLLRARLLMRESLAVHFQRQPTIRSTLLKAWWKIQGVTSNSLRRASAPREEH